MKLNLGSNSMRHRWRLLSDWFDLDHRSAADWVEPPRDTGKPTAPSRTRPRCLEVVRGRIVFCRPGTKATGDAISRDRILRCAGHCTPPRGRTFFWMRVLIAELDLEIDEALRCHFFFLGAVLNETPNRIETLRMRSGVRFMIRAASSNDFDALASSITRRSSANDNDLRAIRRALLFEAKAPAQPSIFADGFAVGPDLGKLPGA